MMHGLPALDLESGGVEEKVALLNCMYRLLADKQNATAKLGQVRFGRCVIVSSSFLMFVGE